MWMDILKKTRRWHKYVDDIMSDKTTRAAEVIHGILLDFLRSDDKYGRKRTGGAAPSIGSIGNYLSSSPKYVKLERSQDKHKWRMAEDVV